jgi:WD40 repeat protein
MKQLFILVTLLFAQVCYAQKQNSVWKFGATGAGLQFRECAATVLTNGINNQVPFEGQSAISDAVSGRLLFYTDGYNAYDSTNKVMSNGSAIGFSNSFTQTIIIKKPGSSTLYYVITPDLQGGSAYNTTYPNARGLNYAVVDMSLNGGLGSVTSAYNSLKDTSNCEKLTAVRHSNGTDIWLIGHEYRNDKFFAYQISSAGISATPVFSTVGPIINTWQGQPYGTSKLDAIGELKASPNGQKLAFTCYYNGTSCIFDFDKSTGSVSNPIPITVEAGGYGVSFSPNNTRLYISGVDTSTGIPDYPSNGKIYQFDLSSNNQALIQASRTTIYTDTTGMFRSLKIGIDGRIYVARGNNSNYLGMIKSPNASGTACGYTHNGVYLNGLKGRWGLNNAIEDVEYCTPTAIEAAANGRGVSVYPNPAKDYVVIEGMMKGSKVVVLSLIGQQLAQFEAAGTRQIISLANLPAAAYALLLISDEGEREMVRIIKE